MPGPALFLPVPHLTTRLLVAPLMLAGFLISLLAGTGAPLLAAGPSGSDPEAAGRLRTVAPVVTEKAMAVTANPHATRAAVAVLTAGGNAVDAALAAQFVLNVVEPQSSGIGGGGFMVAYAAKTGAVTAIDGREETPAGATLADFMGPAGKPLKFFPDRITGGKAVGVPGLLKMLELARRRLGSWPLARILAAALRLAEEGFPVSPRLAGSLRKHARRLALFPATRAVFFDGGGQPLAAGALLRQPGLARSFRLLAREGIEPFSTGAPARALVRAVAESPFGPGRMTLADLAAYDAVLRHPVRSTYRGYTLYGMPPPSSGATTVFQLLNLLETLPVPPGGAGSPEGVHRFVQAARLAYADRRAYLGDPDFTPVPVAGLLDKGYARRRASGIDWRGPLRPVAPGRPPGVAVRAPGLGEFSEHPSTTHLSIADEQGNLVAMTTTVEQAFGSGIVVPGWGFFLNNQLTDFGMRLRDRKGRLIANRMETGRKPRRTALEHPERPGGKRPRSSMAPTLVFRDGRPVLVIGSPGGSRIIQFVARVLTGVLDHGMDLQAAIAAPHYTYGRNRTLLEPPYRSTGIRRLLEARGHRVRFGRQGSGLHGIWFNPATGRLHGGADPRREGLAGGY